jgi:hypothetical protein
MATKAEKYIPNSIQRMAQIVTQIASLQSGAATELAKYQQNGGATMDGIAEFDFTSYGLTQTEYTEGMADLATTHNSVGLSTILTGTAYSRVVKVGNGA